jgi:hypothetical protein
MAVRTKMWMIAGATLAVCGLGGALVASAPVALGGPTPPLNVSISPDPAAPGDDLTIEPATADDLCPIPAGRSARAAGVPVSGVRLSWSILDSSSTEVDSSDGTTTPPDDAVAPITGDWTVSTSAPEAPGDYTFEAICYLWAPPPDADRVAPAAVQFLAAYEGAFTVAAPVAFTVTSDKASGPAGTSVQLTGINCVPGSGTSVAVKLMPVGDVPDFDNTDDSLEVYPVTGADAGFTGPFVVPAGTAAGTYQFVAWCLGEGGAPVTDPQVLGFTVTAPGAVPVPAEPVFTG